MSKWQEIPIKNVEVDDEDLNILVNSDDEGNNYIFINLKDLKELLK